MLILHWTLDFPCDDIMLFCPCTDIILDCTCADIILDYTLHFAYIILECPSIDIGVNKQKNDKQQMSTLTKSGLN